MPGMVHHIIAIWARLLIAEHHRGRTVDAALDLECWDHAIRIYLGREPMPAEIVEAT